MYKNTNINGKNGYYMDAAIYVSTVRIEFENSVSKAKEALTPPGYTKPRNVCEDLVEKELDLLFSRYVDVCRCNQCRADIIALSLKELPARYITDSRNSFAGEKIGNEYLEKVMKAVYKAVKIVKEKPRKTCEKTVTLIWKTADQLDWVN